MRAKIILSLILLCFTVTGAFPEGYTILGKIETVRKDNFVTILFKDNPSEKLYYIVENQVKIGTVDIINIDMIKSGQGAYYRALAAYKSDDGKNRLIRAGAEVGLDFVKKRVEPGAGEIKPGEETVLAKKIVSEIDRRDMMLIPGGNFLMGSNTGDRDEYPERIVYVNDFYIDKYEVSNSAYLVYLKETNSKAPVLWKDGKLREEEAEYPVMVSYSEAEGYAKWAGKRLPSEEEWEKACRGEGIELRKDLNEKFYTIRKPVMYPWGDKFNAEYLNSKEFWDDEKTGLSIKKIYTRGPLPVTIFEGPGNSSYGVVNISGNAPEWTSGWYRAYPGNNTPDKRYGKQMKVIRGGAWYSERNRVRGSSREIGGVPNIYNDYIAGFRCVREIRIAK